ncbi:MAG: hypothetical protein COA69_07610 [Robiginitomaculum sp.]|nr:MAG: hypothetical protein COA69_07610 [Robiginitomaculum sp.]
MNADRDKLITAVYSAGISPEYYHESLETIDTLVFANPAGDADNIIESGSGLPKSNNGKLNPSIDSEILHHIQRSSEIIDHLGRQKQGKSRAELLLDTAPNPAFIFDHAENIIAMNDMARNNGQKPCRKLADCCTNIYVLEQIRTFVFKNKTQKLLIEPGYINAEGNVNTCILVRKMDENLNVPSDKTRYFFTIVNLGFDQSKTGLFKETYELTQAEVDVAVHLASGLQVSEIAAARKAKIDTVRFQIKAIKRKTNSRDIPSIVRLVCGFSAGILTSSQLSPLEGIHGNQPTPLKIQKQITLRDGRNMSYLEQGDPDGAPVLLLHTIPYGAELIKGAAEAAKRMNLRIISPYRPGYGRSETQKNVKGDAYINLVCADMYELLGRLNITRVAIAGIAIGSVYGMRFAHLYPDRVSHLFAISRTPMWKDEWIAKTPRRQRLIMRLTKYTPQLLPLILRATMAYIDKGNGKDLFNISCADSAADILALKNPEISGLMEREFVEGLIPGYEAFHHEIVLGMKDYSQEALRLKHKFYILHGDDDKIFDVSQSQAFADYVPGTKLEIVKGAGHLLIYSHWEHILRAIKKNLN